jgi:hypothetical protein
VAVVPHTQVAEVLVVVRLGLMEVLVLVAQAEAVLVH